MYSDGTSTQAARGAAAAAAPRTRGRLRLTQARPSPDGARNFWWGQSGAFCCCGRATMAETWVRDARRRGVALSSLIPRRCFRSERARETRRCSVGRRGRRAARNARNCSAHRTAPAGPVDSAPRAAHVPARRRQGCRTGGHDSHGSAGAARLHDHHARVHRLPEECVAGVICRRAPLSITHAARTDKAWPAGLEEQVRTQLARLEEKMSQRLGAQQRARARRPRCLYLAAPG